MVAELTCVFGVRINLAIDDAAVIHVILAHALTLLLLLLSSTVLTLLFNVLRNVHETPEQTMNTDANVFRVIVGIAAHESFGTGIVANSGRRLFQQLAQSVVHGQSLLYICGMCSMRGN